MELEKYAQQLRGGPGGAALDALARSGESAGLLAGVDKAALEKAAKAGDMQALGAILQGVLATPEGKRFAREVQKAVQSGGR